MMCWDAAKLCFSDQVHTELNIFLVMNEQNYKSLVNGNKTERQSSNMISSSTMLS